MQKTHTLNSPKPPVLKLGAGLFEAFSSGHLLALLNENNEPITNLVHCKDYFQDQIYSTEYGVVGTQFGFKYEPKPVKEYKLAITSDTTNKPIIDDLAVLETLHYHEDLLAFDRAQMSKLGKYKGNDIIVFQLDQKWFQYVILLSLITLIVRIAMYNTKDNRIFNILDIDNETYKRLGSDNTSIISSVSFKNNYKKVLKGKYHEFRNFGDFESVGKLHNYSGIKNNTIKKINHEDRNSR